MNNELDGKKRYPHKKNCPQKWARDYRSELKWAVIPIRKDTKRDVLVKWTSYQKQLPTVEQVSGWWKQWPDANIAVITGKVSNLMVLDIDTQEARESIKSYGDIPITPTVKTGRGWHYYFGARSRYIGGQEEKKFYPTYAKGNGWELKGESALIILICPY